MVAVFLALTALLGPLGGLLLATRPLGLLFGPTSLDPLQLRLHARGRLLGRKNRGGSGIGRRLQDRFRGRARLFENRADVIAQLRRMNVELPAHIL